MGHAGVRGHNLFQMLQPKQLEAVSNATEELVFKAGSVVYHAGEPADYFYVVREGKVSLHSPTGEIMLHVDDVFPGEVFGTCLCLSRTIYAMEARCEEDTKLMRIRAEALKRTLNDDPVLGYALQGYISGIYFRRYTDALARLQSVVESLGVRPQ